MAPTGTLELKGGGGGSHCRNKYSNYQTHWKYAPSVPDLEMYAPHVRFLTYTSFVT